MKENQLNTILVYVNDKSIFHISYKYITLFL